jgi:tetratricopeptide (TPR) repeat protein
VRIILLLIISSFNITLAFSQEDTTYYNLGIQMEEEGNNLKAIDYYTKSISYCQPNTGELKFAFNSRSLVKLILGDYRGAIIDAENAIAVKPKSSKVYWFEQHNEYFCRLIDGTSYGIIGAAQIQLGNLEAACLSFSKSGEYGNEIAFESIKKYCNPNSDYAIEKLLEEANELIQIDETQKALELLIKAKSIAPENSTIYVYMGYAYIKQKKNQQAIIHLNKADKIKTQNHLVYLLRGLAFLMEGEDKEALKDFNLGLEIEPQNPDLYIYKGFVLAKNGYLTESIRNYNLALKYDKESSEAYFNKGMSQIFLKNYNGGCESLLKAIALGSDEANDKYYDYCSNSTYKLDNSFYQPCIRIGAICFDGWKSTATSQGACSHHGGVYKWLCK